jgi:hypothetical protein
MQSGQPVAITVYSSQLFRLCLPLSKLIWIREDRQTGVFTRGKARGYTRAMSLTFVVWIFSKVLLRYYLRQRIPRYLLSGIELEKTS